MLIDFRKSLPSPFVGLTCLVHFWSKMVERFKRDMGQYLHNYAAKQCTLKWQAIWQQTTSFKHFDNWSVKEGMLGWFKVTWDQFELKKAFGKMDGKRINDFLIELGGEWISWKRNPPIASNIGGVWEQQIRSVRSILSEMLWNHGESVNNESLCTLFVEVEGIINSRPITCKSIGDVNSIISLSPM